MNTCAQSRRTHHTTRCMQLGLLGLLLFLPLLAAASSTLHFTHASNGRDGSGTFHQYAFEGHYDHIAGHTAERILLSVMGTYRPGTAVALESMVFRTGEGDYTTTIKWSCAKDPWIGPSATCSPVDHRTIIAVNGQVPAPSMFLRLQDVCHSLGLREVAGGVCFVTRKLVPHAVAALMRDGPPPPVVEGPARVDVSKVAKVTLKYAMGLANRYWIQQWVCPPGKDVHPDDIPGDVMPFGGACQSSVKGPLKMSPGGGIATFQLAYPAAAPTAGTWYVRARLGSSEYGQGVWGHWHRTVAGSAPLHVKDAPNVAPKILAPNPDQMFVKQGVQITVAPGRARPDASRWEYALEWQRADYNTSGDNVVWRKTHPGNFPRVEHIAKPMKPWTPPPVLRAIPETQGNASASVDYAALQPTHPDSSLQYQFRLREHIRNSSAYGPWSEWRSFIVSPNGNVVPYQKMMQMHPLQPTPSHLPPSKGLLKMTPKSSGSSLPANKGLLERKLKSSESH